MLNGLAKAVEDGGIAGRSVCGLTFFCKCSNRTGVHGVEGGPSQLQQCSSKSRLSG